MFLLIPALLLSGCGNSNETALTSSFEQVDVSLAWWGNDVRHEYTEDIAVVSPYLENDAMIDSFRNACNAVIYERSTAEEQAQKLYALFTED